MKVICQVIAAVALFGIVLCPVEGGAVGIETQGGSDRQCGIPLESGMTEEDLPRIVSHMTLRCVLSLRKALKDKVDTANTTEELQDAFKKFCELTPSFNNCSDTVAVYAQNCVDENLLGLFKVDIETMQKLLRVGCKSDGDRLVTIFQGVVLKNNLDADVDRCFRSAFNVVSTLVTENTTATERRVAIDTGINALRECFLAIPKHSSITRQAFVSIMEDMLA